MSIGRNSCPTNRTRSASAARILATHRPAVTWPPAVSSVLSLTSPTNSPKLGSKPLNVQIAVVNTLQISQNVLPWTTSSPSEQPQNLLFRLPPPRNPRPPAVSPSCLTETGLSKLYGRSTYLTGMPSLQKPRVSPVPFTPHHQPPRSVPLSNRPSTYSSRSGRSVT